MKKSLLESFNPQQREAVLYDKGGALILAGAGTGKTRVLTGRIIHLIAGRQVPAAHILAVTFTNKAAQEMRARIAAADVAPQRLMLGTFHSICHRLLRVHAQSAGLDKSFQILDSQDQLAFLRRLLRARGVDDKRFPPQEVRAFIVAAKESGLRADAVPARSDRDRQMQRLYQWYEDACGEEGKVDFSELLLRVIELWRGNEELRRHYAGRFRHVLVDELQDTSRQQFEWLRLLDSGGNHFFAVGDDDQSIYAFRGAEPGIMREFQSQLRADKLIRLEENYRSKKNILDAANQLISGNRNRLGKTLTTSSGAGAPLEVLASESDAIEAKQVAQLLCDYIRQGGDARQAAVLYRTNAQSRLFERELLYYGVPYRIYGGLRFYDRQEVKHALAYLRLLAGNDRDALLRVINMPPRGIGARTMETLAGEADIFSALPHSDSKKVQAFHQTLAALRQRRGALADRVRAVLEESALLMHYESRNETARAENLRELVNVAAQFEQQRGGRAEEGEEEGEDAPDTLTDFLAAVALEAGGEEAGSNQPAVSLMTVHAAKGLEFNRVFIVGMEEGLFPYAQSIESGRLRDLEEERRLLYVAITRARQQLSLHFARSRMLYGQTKCNPFSRFLDELPPSCLADREWRVPGEMPAAPPRKRPGGGGGSAETPPPPAAGGGGKYRLGEEVRHARYGNGIVLRRLGSGDEEHIEVSFKKAGVKRFKTALAKLQKVSAAAVSHRPPNLV